MRFRARNAFARASYQSYAIVKDQEPNRWLVIGDQRLEKAGTNH